MIEYNYPFIGFLTVNSGCPLFLFVFDFIVAIFNSQHQRLDQWFCKIDKWKDILDHIILCQHKFHETPLYVP